MANIDHHVKFVAIRTVVYMAVLALLTTVIMLLPCIMDPTAKPYCEGGVLEWLQFGLLFLGVLILALAAYLYQCHHQLTFILASLLAAACVRECDSLLDHYAFHHCWKLAVAVILLIAVIVIVKQFRSFAASVRSFVNWPCFGMMLFGFFVVFVFSRIIGHNDFWQVLAAGCNVRCVARAVEETAEFLGYFLLLIAVLEYALTLKQLCPLTVIDNRGRTSNDDVTI